MSRPAEPAASFQRHFGHGPQAIAFAPGRVNLIGEHTDYNEGFVLPLAIQFGVRCAGRLTASGRVQAHSANFPAEPADFALGEPPQGSSWSHYLRAVLAELAAAGVQVRGLQLYFAGDVPDGAGLSSSAAFSVVTTLLVSALVGRSWPDPVALARLCQAAEHRLGVQCGLLDQMASAACRAGSAMLLDCRDLSRRMIPLDRERLAVIVGATGVKRQLAASKYNERRAECDTGAQFCGVRSLREVTPARLEEMRGQLPMTVYHRCRHVLTENERVHAFAAALEQGDLARAGELADQSHASLRDDYAVSCPELDAMVESFQAAEGVYGARMVGAGFGGSAIALADPQRCASIIGATAVTYRQRTGLSGGFYVVTPGDGASVESIES